MREKVAADARQGGRRGHNDLKEKKGSYGPIIQNWPVSQFTGLTTGSSSSRPVKRLTSLKVCTKLK